MFKLIIFILTLAIANSQDSYYSEEEDELINSFLNNNIQEGSVCLNEINRVRQRYGRRPFSPDEKLQNAAYTHNSHMVQNNCFSIHCRGEPSLGERVTRAGYKWSKVGELISANQNDCSSVVESWLKHPSHRDYLLGDYRDLGCSQLNCNHCQYRTYWTCTLANSW